MKKVMMMAVALMCALAGYADALSEYKAFGDTIRSDVYSLDLPAFKVKEIPEKYRNESAVIKGIYESFDAKKKTGVGVRPGPLLLPTVSRRARVEAIHLTRMLIHINDKAALEKYSELDFGIDHKKKYFEGYEKSRRAMGVRLVKSDGSIVDVDTSEFVEVEEGKKGEKKSRKLAIPGLEIGDDIDVFFYTETKMQNVHPDPVDFCLKESAPILNYRVHCVIDDKLTTQYRTLNGAPDFTVSRDEDGNYVLDMELDDISAKEPRLWYSREQQSPMIKMYVFNRRNSSDFTPKSARKDGLQPNPDVCLIQEDRWDEDEYWFSKPWISGDLVMKNYMKDGQKILKELDKMKKNGTITSQEGADYIYNLLCYLYIGHRARMSRRDFAIQLNGLLRSHSYLVESGMSTTNDDEPLDELINLENTVFFTHLHGDSTRYYFPPLGVYAPGEIRPDLQGRKALLWVPAKIRKKFTGTPDYFEIPVSTPATNLNVSELGVTIDGTTLGVDRKESYRGYTKLPAGVVLSEEDVNKGYKEYLERFGWPVNVKESKKEAADRIERYADGLKEQKDDFKEEIEGYHGAAPSEFIDGKVTQLGIDPAAPDLVYKLNYKMDNLVKRAGSNMVLSVGKLFSNQIEVLPSDRDRHDDVDLRAPRAYVTYINIDIPAGYAVSASSLASLNKDVQNAAGCFVTQATLPSPDKISIEIVKLYNKATLPVAEWPELLKVLDAASAWNAATLLLEKK